MKEKTCIVCGIRFLPIRQIQRVCSAPCAIKYAIDKRDKKRAQAERIAQREDRKVVKLKLESFKTRSDWVKEAQVAFNSYIRARDQAAGHACISSGRPLDWTGNAVDAGHYRSTGSAPHLRFDERNCHAQSKHDNRYLAGNAVDYRLGLIARIGLEAVQALEADQEPRKYSIEDLKRIIFTYKLKLKELKK
jgi:predicted nucleic acid-binding Zn ribbon protein